jgi:hypothetical protein
VFAASRVGARLPAAKTDLSTWLPGYTTGGRFLGARLAGAGGALISPPLTTFFLLSSAATLPPRSTRRHPRARPTIASSISRQTTRHARAPACGCAAAGTGGAEMGQRRSSARAEARQPLCWWNRGVDPGCKSTMTHSSWRCPDPAWELAVGAAANGVVVGSGEPADAQICDGRRGPAATSRSGPATTSR